LDTLEQRYQVSLTLGGGKTELGRVATDGIRKLRAIADQPITQPDHHQGCLLLSCLYGSVRNFVCEAGLTITP
jgi:hypothetical protein